jgi:hypothetical protein
MGKPLAALAVMGVLALQAAPASAYWVETANRDRSYFIPKDSATRMLASSTVTGNRFVPAGKQRFDGAKQVVSKTARTSRTDLKNPYRETLKNGSYEVTKLVREDRWNDVQYKTPWSLYSMKQPQEQKTLHYAFVWSDPDGGDSYPDPVTESLPWADSGAPVKDQLLETGSDLWDHLVKEDATFANLELLLAKVPQALAANDAQAAKSGVFSSDRGQAAASLTGSKVRAALKANEAIASQAKAPAAPAARISNAAPQKLTADSWLGTWKGGGHTLTFRPGKNDTLSYSFNSFNNAASGTLNADKDAFRDTSGDVTATLRLERVDGELRLRGTVSAGKRDHALDLGK